MRKAISVTLGEDNVLWLRGQAATTPRGSLSEVLDQIVSDARATGRYGVASARTVRNTIDLPDDDPGLQQADRYVRGLFDASVRRPMPVKESPSRSASGGKKRKRG